MKYIPPDFYNNKYYMVVYFPLFQLFYIDYWVLYSKKSINISFILFLLALIAISF